MSLSITVPSPSGFPVDLASRISAALRTVGVEIELYPKFTSSTWEGGFLPVKVVAMPRDLLGAVVSAPILAGFEIDFEASAACLRSPASRSVADYALFCLLAVAMAKETSGRFEMEGVACAVSREHPFSAAMDAAKNFAEEAKDEDRRLTPFVSWEAVE